MTHQQVSVIYMLLSLRLRGVIISLFRSLPRLQLNNDDPNCRYRYGYSDPPVVSVFAFAAMLSRGQMYANAIENLLSFIPAVVRKYLAMAIIGRVDFDNIDGFSQIELIPCRNMD
jgi:hypothetical protein